MKNCLASVTLRITTSPLGKDAPFISISQYIWDLRETENLPWQSYLIISHYADFCDTTCAWKLSSLPQMSFKCIQNQNNNNNSHFLPPN